MASLETMNLRTPDQLLQLNVHILRLLPIQRLSLTRACAAWCSSGKTGLAHGEAVLRPLGLLAEAMDARGGGEDQVLAVPRVLANDATVAVILHGCCSRPEPLSRSIRWSGRLDCNRLSTTIRRPRLKHLWRLLLLLLLVLLPLLLQLLVDLHELLLDVVWQALREPTVHKVEQGRVFFVVRAIEASSRLRHCCLRCHAVLSLQLGDLGEQLLVRFHGLVIHLGCLVQADEVLFNFALLRLEPALLPLELVGQRLGLGVQRLALERLGLGQAEVLAGLDVLLPLLADRFLPKVDSLNADGDVVLGWVSALGSEGRLGSMILLLLSLMTTGGTTAANSPVAGGLLGAAAIIVSCRFVTCWTGMMRLRFETASAF